MSVPAGLYHPDQRVYVPPRFSREPLPADPGATEWFYGDVADHHGFLHSTLRDIRPLDHQLARFPEGDSTIVRADVAFVLDDIAPSGAPVELGLFVLDSTLSIIAETRDTVDALGRLARGWVQTLLPPTAYAYSIEARELATGQAARARHALPSPPSGDLVVSDLVLLSKGRDTPARGDVAFVPLGSLLLERDQEATMYFELRGLAADAAGAARYRTDLRVLQGREGTNDTPAISWTLAGRSADTIPVTIDLGTLPVGSGVHRLIVTVTDLIGGTTARMERIVKIR